MDDKLKQRLESKLAFTKRALDDATARNQAHQTALNAKRAELDRLIYGHNNQVRAITDALTVLEGPQRRQALVDVEVATGFHEAAKAEMEREKLKAEAQSKGLRIA